MTEYNSLSLKELIEQVHSDCNKDMSLEFLYLYFKGAITKISVLNGVFDSDLYSTLTIAFVKSCTVYKNNEESDI